MRPSRVLGFAFTIAVIAGCSTTTEQARPAVTPSPTGSNILVFDCMSAAYKPTTITLSCADANLRLEKLVWTEWDSTGAKGTGELTRNTCSPDCAGGHFVTEHAVVALSKPVPYQAFQVFSSATFTTPDGKSETDSIVTSPLR